MKVEFNKVKDIKNIWETANEKGRIMDFSSKMPKELLEICKGKEFNKARFKIERYFKEMYDSEALKQFVKAFEKSWNSIEDEYMRRLKKITKKPLDNKNIKAYVTFAPRCIYNIGERWFMVNFFSSLPTALMTAGHELMHFHFHEHYFGEVEEQIGWEKTHDLKEALTFLLNVEFIDLWYIADWGYEPHKKLRRYIYEQWKKSKDFDNLIKNCIKFIKKS